MSRNGQAIGIAMAVAVSAAAAAVGFAAGGFEFLRPALWSGFGFLVATAPAGLLMGRRYDRLKTLAERDSLTGSYTRRFVQHVYPRLVGQADRSNKRFSVLLIDVNDFKLINDTLGHSMGDELLRRLASIFSDSARHGEIVGRWGGDEFLLMCPYGDRVSLDALNMNIGERMAQLSSQWNRPLSVSVGSAVYPDDGRVIEELVQEADRRMYAEKNRRIDSAALPQRMNA